MGTIKNIVTTTVMYLVAGAATIIGISAGSAIWENGLGDKVTEKTQKVFSKKEED